MWKFLKSRYQGSKKENGRIEVQPDLFKVFLRKAGEFVIPWNSISQVTAFKRDLLWEDSICLQIEWRSDQEMMVEIYEELNGFTEFTIEMEKNLNINHEWWGNVVQPPFATNLAIIYRR